MVHLTHRFDKQLEIVDFGEQAAIIRVPVVVKAKVKELVQEAEIVHLVHQVLQDEKLVIIRAKRMIRKKEIKEAKEVQLQNGFKLL